MKLIIDIPEEIYQEAIESGYSHLYDEDVANAVADGIPLDSVKAEIEKEENIWYHDCEPENNWKHFDVIRVDTVCEILDNIGSEVKANEETNNQTNY